jgi:thiol-disulfide isomerase/thioredoxin
MNTVLYLSADWCGPCKLVKPVVFKWAEDHPEYDVKFIDIDAYPHMAETHHVQSVPTLIVLDEDANELDRYLGIHQIRGFIR